MIRQHHQIIPFFIDVPLLLVVFEDAILNLSSLAEILRLVYALGFLKFENFRITELSVTK